MGDPFLGEIRAFGFNFAPPGWAMCNGSLLPISQNTALFSLLGTTYGGNGVQTFGLPDLRGRAVVGVGQGPGLGPRFQGESFGNERTTLTTTNLPAHSHTATATSRAANARASSNRPVGAIPATGGSYADTSADTGNGAPITVAVQPAGQGQAFDNTTPSQVLNYCICTSGIFPSRP